MIAQDTKELPRGLKGAVRLLRQAQEIYDQPDGSLATASRKAWQTGFASGGRWMALALAHLRRGPESGTAEVLPATATLHSLTGLGVVKYGLACAATMPWLILALLTQQPLWALACVPAFYTVEAQMVFLFPLALDGCVHPYRESLRWTRAAGGTLTVMGVVLPIAATMLLGGFAGRGFVRSWCLGCFAVCVWYEDLRVRDSSRATALPPLSPVLRGEGPGVRG